MMEWEKRARSLINSTNLSTPNYAPNRRLTTAYNKFHKLEFAVPLQEKLKLIKI